MRLTFEIDGVEVEKNEALTRFLQKIGYIIEASIVEKTTQLGLVKTGRFRSSIHSYMKGDTLIIADNVEYGCVLYSQDNYIPTDNGFKSIGQLNIGDNVLCQDGSFKPIERKYIYNVKNPEIIQLIIPWRKKKNHILNVTKNHKILTKENGATCWKKANDLKEGDIVFTRKKINNSYQNKKRIKRITLFCKKCKKSFQMKETDLKYRNGNYCSIKCRANNGLHIGLKRTTLSRRKMSFSQKERFKNNPESHPNRILAKKGYQTNIEKEIENKLKKDKKVYIKQHKIGNHFVDFFLPEENRIIEVDGAFWHKNQEKDIERDKELLKINPNLKISHIHFADKRFTKEINNNPLPNVYYQICNPSLESYVDLSLFKETPIEKINQFIPRSKNNGTIHRLYDLQIKDIHSYICNGILISNSYLEFGTTTHMVKPVNKKSLHWKEDGKDRFSKGHMVSGIKVYAPFRRGLVSAIPRIREAFNG